MSDTAPGQGPERPRDAGGQVLVWMRDEFEALRRQVHALATSVAQQRAMLTDLGGTSVADLTTSLAELEGCAAALRTEATRLQSIEHSLGERLATVVGAAVAQQVGEVSIKGIEDLLQDRLTDVVADAVRPQLRAAIAARLPELVNEVVQPQVKAALADLHGCTVELRDEYAKLRTLRDDLLAGFPRLVETAVERVLARQPAAVASSTPPPPPAPPRPVLPPGPAAGPPRTGEFSPVTAAPPSRPTNAPQTPAGRAPAAAVQAPPAPTAPTAPTQAPPAQTRPSVATALPSGSTPPAPAPSAAPARTPDTQVPAAQNQATQTSGGQVDRRQFPAAAVPSPIASTPPADSDPKEAAPAGPDRTSPAASPTAAPAPPAEAGDVAAGGPSGATAPAPAGPAKAGTGAGGRFAGPGAGANGPSGPGPSRAAVADLPPPRPTEPPPRPAAQAPRPDPARVTTPRAAGSVDIAPPPEPAPPAPTTTATTATTAKVDGPAPATTSGNGPAAPATRGVRFAEAAAAAAAAADGVPDGIACVLPGMAVGPSLAVGVAEALGRARLRRRRRRRAAPPAAGLYRRDPFAGHVTRRLERFARGRATAPAVPARSLGAGGWATLVVGERDGEEVSVDLSTSGLVLAGPGGADVVRAAITGLLAVHEPSAMAAVVIGDLLPAVPPFPGLVQTSVLGPAVDQLTVEVERRVRLLADDDVPDAGAYRAKHPDALLPLIVLAATDVGDADLERLRALFQQGARAGVTGMVIAAGGSTANPMTPGVVLSAGAVVAEAPDALAERLVGARLFRMEPKVASELLAVLASARTDGDHMRPDPDDDESFVPATSAATAPVAVQLLGVYRIEVDGTEIKSGLRAKAKELLAFYLLHPEGATLDDAVEALWPEADPRRGSEWFWTALGNLRTKLRQATGQKELKVIDRDGDLYRIEDVFDVDLWSLQHALREGAESRDDAVRQASLDRAVADYDGDLLVGADWFWLDTPREDLRQRMVDVLVWLGDRRWAAGDARAAWSALQRALEVDPFAEQIYRRIMRLQAKLSRPDDAEATYRRLVAKLQEVDLQPTAETDKLHAEVCPPA